MGLRLFGPCLWNGVYQWSGKLGEVRISPRVLNILPDTCSSHWTWSFIFITIVCVRCGNSKHAPAWTQANFVELFLFSSSSRVLGMQLGSSGLRNDFYPMIHFTIIHPYNSEFMHSPMMSQVWGEPDIAHLLHSHLWCLAWCCRFRNVIVSDAVKERGSSSKNSSQQAVNRTRYALQLLVKY